tara:strand:+ start:404 stop:595 length:192 start_codon:yes stop_codon:yes gene_type:complete
MDYIQIYSRLPTDIAICIAEYDINHRKNMQSVLNELLDYHYMEWVEHNTPGGWAGRNELEWSS